MRLRTTLWASVSLILGAGWLWAEPAETQPPRLVATLLDGSMLSGSPATNAFPIEASFARITLDLRQVQSVEFREPGVATAILAGGDKVSGKVGCAGLALATAAGMVKLPVASLRSLDLLSGIVPAELRKGLVAHLAFNDEASFESNAGEWDGKAVATGTRCIPDGFAGGACRFEPGRHAVRLAHAPEFASPHFTLAMWMRGGKTEIPGRGHYEQSVVSKRGPQRQTGFWLSVRQRQIYFGVGGPQQNYNTIATPMTTADDWWMIAATYDGRTMRLIGPSGVLSTTEWSSYAPAETDLLLGASGLDDDGRTNWSGDLDEFLFFSRALSAEEVAHLNASALKRRRFAAAGVAPTAGPLRVMAELTEGSRIKGEMEPLKLSVHNALAGTLGIPLGVVRGIRFASGTNEVVMTLASGDLIKGTMNLEAIKVRALFGAVTLPVAVLSTLSVGDSPADLPAVKPAGVTAAALATTPADLRVVKALIEPLTRGGQKEREKAVAELVRIGAAALPPLREALKSADADTKWWVEAAIQQIQDRAGTR
jgi:hypothetical protein